VALRKDEKVHRIDRHVESGVRERDLPAPIHQAYVLGRLAFTVVPIVAGLDKFANVLITGRSWTDYLWPGIPRMTGIDAQTLMLGVGVIEIVAGVLVFLSARHFAWLVAAWLGLIIGNLIMLGQYWDIAARDLGLMLGAIVVARLAQGVHEAQKH
jgi:uncharacterized membrane protein YphA (DoxX/SURF4 family)